MEVAFLVAFRICYLVPFDDKVSFCMEEKQEMGKSRTDSIRDRVNPVRQLVNSNKIVLKNVVHNSSFQEHWITRFLAFGLDYIILLFVTGIVKDLVFANWNISMIDYFLMLGALAFLYFVITESILGYTLGKRIFDLKVVTVNGNKPSFRNVFIRNISKIVFVFLILDVIGNWFTAKNLHQRYIDKIAHTTVEKL
jgi:uncharacterized RDD family membrane protein YckC